MKILIIGLGSIGRRHAQNFHALGCEIGGVDTNFDRIKEAILKVPVTAWPDLNMALTQPWDGVVIATPPAGHIDQFHKIIQPSVGKRPPLVLMEKNLCLDYGECEHLSGTPTGVVLMGYTWRWWPNIDALQILLPKVGQIRQVQFTMSAHLADWHPYEPIEQFYAAERGGVLNEAHWHDIMLMMLGMPKAVWASYDKISDLPIQTPDVLDSVFYYDGFRVNLHYDLYKRPHERSMRVVGERGTLEWTPNEIRISNVSQGGWDSYTNNFQRNDMFMNMAREFLSMIKDGVMPRCTLQDGINVMKLLALSKQSNSEKRIVEV